MRVAVVTPYFKESIEVLRQCHESVLRQTHPCTHFLIGDGVQKAELSTWQAEKMRLEKNHSDNGDTPRGFGALKAVEGGYDAIAFLDADNWYYPEHIEMMVTLQSKEAADVCVASRDIYRLDGSFLFHDNFDSDGISHVDTSCLFLARPAFEVLSVWQKIPRPLSPVCDRVFWQAILKRRYKISLEAWPTVAFRTQYDCHYLAAAEAPPPGAKVAHQCIAPAYGWWRALDEPKRKALQLKLGINDLFERQYQLGQ